MSHDTPDREEGSFHARREFQSQGDELSKRHELSRLDEGSARPDIGCRCLNSTRRHLYRDADKLIHTLGNPSIFGQVFHVGVAR